MTTITSKQLVVLIKDATDLEAAAALLDAWKGEASVAEPVQQAKRHSAVKTKPRNPGGKTLSLYWKIIKDHPGLTAMEIVTEARLEGAKKLIEMSDEEAVAVVVARMRKDTTKKGGNRIEHQGRYWFLADWTEYQNPRLKADDTRNDRPIN